MSTTPSSRTSNERSPGRGADDELEAACNDAAASWIAALHDADPDLRAHDVPEAFQLEGELRGTPVRVASRAYTGEYVAYARVTRMEAGEFAQALNALWLPKATRSAPIWTCEMLSLRGHLHLLLGDAHPLAEASAPDAGHAASVADAWSDVWTSGPLASTAPTPLPDWGADDEPEPFSDHALFAKPGASAGCPPEPGLDVLSRGVRAWSACVPSADRDDAHAPDRRERRRALVDIHRRCEPTAEFLGRLADPETIRSMTRTYLYPDWLDEASEPPAWIDAA